jgi:xanthine dehydrogenase YagS FAD-binding subunit
MTEFHLLPGSTPDKETVLQPGEMIVAVHLPGDAARFAAHSRYLKVRERTSYAFAVVSAAAALDIESGKILNARIALGGVALKPWRAEAAEASLVGKQADRATFMAAVEAALDNARPSGDNAYKIDLAKRVVARALLLAAAGTPERVPALPASPLSPVPAGVLNV